MSEEEKRESTSADRVRGWLKEARTEPGEPRRQVDQETTKGVQQLLELVAESPEGVDGDTFGRLDEAFGDVNGAAWCPCGSGATFHGCCKSRWLPAKRAWDRHKKEGREEKKEAVRHVREQAGKDDVHWLGMIGVDPERGPIVAPCPGTKGANLSALVQVLPEMWGILLGMQIRDNIFAEMNAAAAQARQARDVTRPMRLM